jgi:hypothetical protein
MPAMIHPHDVELPVVDVGAAATPVVLFGTVVDGALDV